MTDVGYHLERAVRHSLITMSHLSVPLMTILVKHTRLRV
jgi:hypothetical protein